MLIYRPAEDHGLSEGLRRAIDQCLRAGDSPRRILASARFGVLGQPYSRAVLIKIEEYLESAQPQREGV